nr:reverse transcriptase domain-containing protein [Tanacetum cinerariifolium]
MANTTPIVTTVTKAANKEKTSKEADVALKVNILDFCEEHYEDILLVIMDKIRRDKRKEVHARLDFRESPKKSRRVREGSQNSSAGTLPARYRNPSERPKMRDRLRYNDGNVFDRLGHRRQRTFDRLSDTYSPSTTKSGSDKANSRDRSHNRGRPRRRDSSPSRDRPRRRDRLCGIKELYGTARVWFDELPPESIDGYKDLKAAFLAYFMQQKKYVKDPVEIHNIKQRDGETIEDFMERFKTMEEMMTATTAFIRGETVAASKKKGHTSWKPQDQPKRHVLERRSDFRGQPREGRGSNRKLLSGGRLSAKGRTELCSLLEENLDIFAWQPSDMMGVPRSVAKHRLNIREGYPPVRQKKRGQAPKRARAIQVEVQKLVEAWIMREVYYHDWLSNPFMVKKHDGSWRIENGFPHQPLSILLYQNALRPQERWRQIPAVEKAFDSQVGWNIEVYADDLLIKSHTETEMPSNIDETFRTLRKINMKLNPKKCTFGAVEGMFLGYMISPEGIKSCPDKTKAVMRLPSPRTIKEVQSLNGKLASLNRFFSKLAENSLPLFKTLKKCIKKSDFHWTPEAEQAFKQLKAISAVLMTEKDTVQTPVYFVNRALHGPELNYTPMEKLVLAPVFAAKRLRRYFQAHPIAVITDQPIKQIMSRPDVAGRLQKIERHAGRTQYHVPAEDICERTDPTDFLVEKPDEASPDTSGVETPQEPWTLFTDGSSCVDYQAEYKALMAGLRIATQMGARNVHVSVDSKLVVNQVLRTYVAKEENMIKYLEKAKSLVSSFANFSISQILRSKNKKVDSLSKIALTSFTHLSNQVLVEVLKEKSIQEKEVATVVEEDGPTWMTPIMEYLKDGTLPDDRKEANKLRIKARQYELLEGVLYRRSFLKSWLRCVGPLQADYVILEIHEGSCSMHGRPWSVVAKAMRLGYYWPTMHRDAQDMIRKCKDCQIHRPSNGIVERANRSLGEGIKARLGEGNKNWIEELPRVLWAHRTMIKSSHGDTPFSLTYGTEAVIPAEIGMPTYRTTIVDAVHNDKELRLNLDLLEERRVTFRPRDFVYRSNDASHAVDGGKLGRKWEGPYEVTEALGDGAYRLRSMNETVLPRTWNIANLEKCYL